MKLRREVFIPYHYQIQVDILDEKKKKIRIRGPLGECFLDYPKNFRLTILESSLFIDTTYHRKSNELRQIAFLKTMESLFHQSFKGVTLGHRKQLKLFGLGYKATVQKKHGLNYLILRLGLSHAITFRIPFHINVTCPRPSMIHISGCCKQSVNNFTAHIYKTKVPEPYKGKGVIRTDQKIRFKEGKRG